MFLLFGDAGLTGVLGECTNNMSFILKLIFSTFFVGAMVGGPIFILLLLAYVAVRFVANRKKSDIVIVKKINRIFIIGLLICEVVVSIGIFAVTFDRSDCWNSVLRYDWLG